MNRPSNRTTRDSGSALVVALILLMLLTMIGVQGMRTNVMQERMAGNMRERNLAFQAAEAALRVGEAEDDEFTVGKSELVAPTVWYDALGWNSGAGADDPVTDFDASVAEDPHYHVGPPQYVRVGVMIPPEWRYLHPVTAIGFGGQIESVVVVQSSFEPIN